MISAPELGLNIVKGSKWKESVYPCLTHRQSQNSSVDTVTRLQTG
jgi:hypothetical protein